MKRLILLAAFLPFAAAHAQVVQTVAAPLSSAVITPKAAGDTLLVQCDYNIAAPPSGITDSAGTAFTAIGGANVSGTFSQIVSISAPLAAVTSDTVKCPAASTNGEIYVVEMAGAVSVDAFLQTNGASSPASGNIATTAGDTVVGFCVTGNCTVATGWTALSHFDNNLVAAETSTGSSVAASFKTSDRWVLTLVAIKPAGSTSPPPPPPTVVPSFSCTPSFLPVTFSTFVPSGAKGLTFSVLNPDPANPLVISTISPPPGFAIDGTPPTAAAPLSIAPGDSQTFTIRFVPTAAGIYGGNVVFLANVANGNFQMGVQGVAK